MKSVRVVAIVPCLLLAVSVAAAAQTVSVTGRVTDPLGAPVAGATVTLTARDGSALQTARTAADGSFALAPVQAGEYRLHIEAPGFERRIQNLTVGAATPPVEVALRIAAFAETVTVAAPRLEEELPQIIERAGVRVQTITAAEIQNGGYNDVAQALQALVPGLFLVPKAGAFDYVTASLQGSRTNEILWLVDGVRISNRLYNGTTPLDTLPAHMVERIEVIEGGQGLFYGTQAVAGVINVVTKAFTEDPSARAQAGFDTNQGGHVNAFVRDSRGGHRYVLFASRDKADGYRPFPDNEFQPSTTDRRRSYDVATVGAKYAYDVTGAIRFSVAYQRNAATVDNLRPARSSAGQIGGLSAAFNDRTEHILSSKLDVTPRPDVELYFKGYYHRWDSAWTERRNAIATGGERVISDGDFWGFKDYGANLLARVAPDRRVELFAGYDLQNYSGRDDVLLIAPNTETVHAVFGQVRTTRALLPRAAFAAGVRYNAPSHSRRATVWNLSGRYDFPAGTFVRGTVGTAFRYPDAYELFAVDPTCCFGNPNLRPESSTNVNASVGHRIDAGGAALALEAIGFYRRVKDLIVDVDDGSGETTITMNQPDTVRVRGVSLTATVAAGPAVSGRVGYTYTRSQRTNTLAGGYSALAGIPSNQVEGTIDLHPAARPFGLTLTVNGVGEMFDTVAGFGQVRGGRYAVVDAAGRLFFDARRRHRISVRLENLFNERYTTLHQRGVPDAGGPAFLVHNLGTPRTLHVSYSVSY